MKNVEELMDDTKREYLPKKERDIILFNVRKMVSDLDTLLLYIDSYTGKISATDENRIRQYIKNNQARAKTVLWQLTSLSFKRGKNDKNKKIDKNKIEGSIRNA